MNVNQKILTGTALLAFIISVFNASWEVTAFDKDGNIVLKVVITGPVWQQPDFPQYLAYSSTRPSTRHEWHLDWPPLVVIWIAIGIVYTGLFFLLKNTPSVLGISNSSSKQNDNR